MAELKILEKVVELSQFGVLSLIGGMANYFYYNEKNNRVFSVIGFLTNVFLSYFIGMIAGDWLPESDNKYGLIMVCGFCCYPILGLIESKIKKWIEIEKNN